MGMPAYKSGAATGSGEQIVQFVAVWLPVVGSTAGHAGELVSAVVGRRLELIPIVHAVVALELGIVRQRGQRGPAVLGVVEVEVIRLVIQREEEQVRTYAGARGLARAVHVGDVIAIRIRRKPWAKSSKLLVWVVSTNCEGRRYAVRGNPFLVQVDGHMRNQRFPLRLNEHHRVVKGTGGGINDMALDAAVLARDIGLFAEFEEAVLAGEALPAFDSYPRRIDTARGKLGRAFSNRGSTCAGRADAGRITHRRLYRLARAVRSGAIHRARYAQVA